MEVRVWVPDRRPIRTGQIHNCPRCLGQGPNHLGLRIPYAEYAEIVKRFIAGASAAREPDINVRVRLTGQLAYFLLEHREFLRFHPDLAAAVFGKFAGFVREIEDPALNIAVSARRLFHRAVGRLLHPS